MTLAGGVTIDTTAEHPFFEESLGWIEARSLTPGHRLRTLDGSTIAVESVAETGQWQPVYNLRVADWHTYFVGDDEWGFSVWAHNACTAVEEAAALRARSKLGARVTEAIPPGQPIRTPKEYAQTSDFYRNNKPLARRLWEERTGRKWPVDENGKPFTADHNVGLGGRRERADPLDVTPGRGSAAKTANGDRTLAEMRATGAKGTPAREFNKFIRKWLESIRGNAD
ncbi:HINT domain-containing protein [Tuwongella immobilis]|uniref:HINT domain-containing protein n=1 Tax=Tuwongella immobilis TaxID=692036 RepID=UPI0021BCBCD2|nr:HINT domain-containing protein [Tuwongella immobilis]